MSWLGKLMRSEELPWLAAVLAYFGLLHREVIFLGRHWLDGDNGFQNFPWHYFVWDRVRHGGLTEPCPAMGLGFELVAEPQAQCFYPLNTALWPIPDPFVSFTLKLLLHLLLAVLGVYVLARRDGRSPLASAAAAVVMAAGAFTVFRIVHTPIICALAWAPWIVLMFLQTLGSTRLAPFLGLVGCLAGALLAGQPQVTVYVVLACLVLGWGYAEGASTRLRVLSWARGVGLLMVAALCAAVLGAVQLVPTWELSLYGMRAEPLPGGMLTQWGCSLRELAVVGLAGWRVPWHWEKASFPGSLALMGIAYCALWYRDRRTRAWLALVPVALLLAWSQGNPLTAVVGALPVLDRMRAHGRAALLISLTGGMLLARMLDDRRELPRWRVPTVAAATLIVLELLSLGATGRLGLGPIAGDPMSWQVPTLLAVLVVAALFRERAFSSPWSAGALVALAAVELLLLGQHVNPTFTREQWLTDPLQRTFAWAAQRTRQDGTAFLRWKDGLPSNVGIYYGVRYPRAFSPLAPLTQDMVNQVLYGPNCPETLAAFGVKWLAAPSEWGDRAGLRRVDTLGEWGLYENPLPVAEAYVPAQAPPGTPLDALSRLREQLGDPRYLVHAPPEIVGRGLYPGPDAQVRVLRSTNTELVLEVNAPGPCVVVATRQWTPHWSATLDGQPVPVFSTNLTLLSSVSGQGVHTLRFEYRLDLRRPGAVSALAALVWLVMVTISLARERRRREGC